MDDQHYSVVGFGLAYAGQLVYCEAVMNHNEFDVLFDGKWVASIAHNDDCNWMQASGTILPEQIISEIGLKIESHYE